MSQPNRLAQGGRIDRDRPLTFTFNGKRYQGYAGDTLAAALLANGVLVVGRSFKLHRPRGLVSAGPEEPNAIMQVGSGAAVRPDQRATQVELYAGLEASTAARLGFDPMGANDLLSVLLPAGFYYKTFMWPKNAWSFYERHIRKAHGLGYAPDAPDPARYDKMHAHCDVLIVGAGPAGLSAARVAGRAGARVMLVDEQAEFGGSLLASTETINDRPAAEWVDEVVAELAAMPEVRLLNRATAFGHYDHNFVGVLEDRGDYAGNAQDDTALRHRYWRIRAARVVHATGAQERPLVFANNDRPGVMIASAVSTYVNRYGVVPGNSAVVFTNNDSAYRTALDLHGAKVEVKAVVDVRNQPSGDLAEAVREANIPIYDGHVISNVRGAKKIQSVAVQKLSGDELTGDPHQITCDFVASSGGWSPVVHLHCHAGRKPVWDDESASFLPPPEMANQASAGSVTGVGALQDCLDQGLEAGAEAARATGFTVDETPDINASAAPTTMPIQPFWLVPKGKPTSHSPKQFVDFQNDTTAADIELAIREGYESIQHVKRYTALGFGTDQGKLGNINGMAIAARALGQTIPETGTSTYRPAYTPVAIGAMAGRDVDHLYDPVRKTPMHDWHVEHGALFENVGQWKRAWYYPKAGETMQDSLNRECLATRQHVGLLDYSTLGKIEIHGADANLFLDMIYTGGRKKMKTGTCRYGLMLHEDGMIFDDGITAKLDENHYYVTTTSGGAAGVLRWLELWHQTEWPHMDVFFTSVTDQWATLSLNGPESRQVVEALCDDDIDFSREAFPFMTLREGMVAGVPARLFRVSFSGELGFEINVSANYGRHVWEAVMAAGEPYGITPYGTETMHILRAEKGFIVTGHDTDGTMTPMDMGMHWAIGKKKVDFIGKRSLDRPDMGLENRKQFVGLLTKDPAAVLPEGAQLVAGGVDTSNPSFEHPVPMEGHVSSSYYSAALGHSIAFALVKGGHKRHGEMLRSPQPDGNIIEAEITGTIFYDPEGEKQNV
jgi:sarcosine oxidase subunit alpha